jgi:hypothetical protein
MKLNILVNDKINKNKNNNNNNRFSSLLNEIKEEPIIKDKMEFVKKDNNISRNDYSRNDYSRNDYSRNDYSSRNGFVDQKIQREKELKQKQILEKEKNDKEFQDALNENNFLESLVKVKRENIIENNPNPNGLNFADKLKTVKFEEEKQVVQEEPIQIVTKQEYITVNKPKPSVVFDELVKLYNRQEKEERFRLGDELYEKKYGINDESYADYFDMLDELEEEDSEEDEEEEDSEYEE